MHGGSVLKGVSRSTQGIMRTPSQNIHAMHVDAAFAREPRPQHSEHAMRLCCAPVVVRKRFARLLSELGQRLLRRKACHGSGADRLSPHRQLGVAASITNHTAGQQWCRDDAI